MPKRPEPDVAGSTLIDADAAEDQAPGATAFVRIDKTDGETRAAATRAPGRGDAAAPRRASRFPSPTTSPLPAPPPRPAPIPEEKKGRRGAWWDARHEPVPEPGPDDLPVAPSSTRRNPRPSGSPNP